MLHRRKKRDVPLSPLLTECRYGSTFTGMDMDENLPRKADDILTALTRQDLDPFSVAELDERMDTLRAEIARTQQRRDYAVNHKASAEALFRK